MNERTKPNENKHTHTHTADIDIGEGERERKVLKKISIIKVVVVVVQEIFLIDFFAVSVSVSVVVVFESKIKIQVFIIETLIDWLIDPRILSLALDDLKATGEFVILWRTNEKPVLKSMTLAVVSHCFFFCKLSMKLNKTNKQTNVWNAHASPLLLLLLLNKFQSQKQQQNWFCKIEIKYLKFESEVWNKNNDNI